MSEVIIRAVDLVKVYRLYSSPHYRLLDMFGLLRWNRGAYTERAAVAGINLEIRRGEKVAIIGRNGAGKSTLLKLITKVIEPTSGSVQTAGRVHAVLQIGTGFHPDFTGRENVYSHLAHLGVTGAQADRKFSEIVEFAELEEYIDQPVKTYSTGMGVRLMFSTSTAIEPDVLVLDEVLAVGDAYFSHKSFERIHELSARHATTVLLVTHDVYSATRLCDRFLWLDRGVMKLDAPAESAVEAYERSIRDQEERRLNLRRLDTLARNRERDMENGLFGCLRWADEKSAGGALWISDVRVLVDGRPLASFSVEVEADEGRSGVLLDEKEGNWGPLETREGRAARRFLTHGAIFHRLPFMIFGAGVARALQEGRIRILIGCRASSREAIRLCLSHPAEAQDYEDVAAVLPDGWEEVSWTPARGAVAAPPSAQASGKTRYGSRAVEIAEVSFLDAAGRECHQFPLGSTLRVSLRYRINDEELHERPIIVVAFQKDGVVRSHRFWTDQIELSARRRREGTIEARADPLLLGAGRYLVTVSLFRAGYFQSGDAKRFFSANPGVYDMHSRGYEIVVGASDANLMQRDVIFFHPASWLRDGESCAPSGDPGQGRQN